MSNQPRISATRPVSTKFRLVSRLDDALTNDDPATELLRDFTSYNPLTIRSSQEIQEIQKKLELSGEAFCVVVNRSDDVMGILLLKDLIGSWPMSLANQRGSSITDIVAKDVMRPVWSLPVIESGKLKDMKVDDLIPIFNELHSDYLLVTDVVAEGGDEGVIRGLLSADDLSQRLGVRVDPDPRPESFSDIVHAVRKNSG